MSMNVKVVTASAVKMVYVTIFVEDTLASVQLAMQEMVSTAPVSLTVYPGYN